MKSNQPPEKGFLFDKKHKVSIWASKQPYADIPDDYFEETFFKNNTRAKNQWSNNFKIRYFKPDEMETNGSYEGLKPIQEIAGACSFSTSFIDNLMSKAKKKQLLEVSWLVLLFDFEYSAKATGVESDDYLTLLGAFNYDDEAESLVEVEQEH